MKRHLIFPMMLAIALDAAGAVNSESWVRQTDLTSGLVYDVPLASTGGPFTAPLPVSEAGSTFDLYARGTAWDTKVYLLDTKLIRAYSPVATVEIASEDSYVRGDPTSSNYVRRTRADRPFSVKLRVSGLVAGSTSQAERNVYFSCKGRKYDLTSFSSLNQPEFLISESILANGDVNMTSLYHQLGTNPLKNGCGEQTYTFVRYAADGVPDTILTQPKIEIWPVATAAVSNISASQVFIDRIPSVVLTMNYLYPDSHTYAQVYPGPAVLGTAGTMIKDTERRFGVYYNPGQVDASTNVPQNVSISIDDLSNYAAADGIYTLEVITETPFFGRAPERLFVVTFEVDRVISSRGQITTSEKPSS